MFSDELKNISWQETTERIASMTDADVRRALGKSHCDINDFMALLSPAAEPYLEQMARLSRKYTEERFGRTMSMFIPLYITNSLFQLMRLLRFPPRKPHGTHYPHPRTDR